MLLQADSVQIWRHIVEVETHERELSGINIPFHSSAVYYYWNQVCSQEWRLADDPLDSAREFIAKRGKECHIATLDVPEQPGTRVLAFQVTDFMKEWATNTQELGMDSTCEYSSNNTM